MDTTTQYKIGDTANGYILTEGGWVLLTALQAPPAKKTHALRNVVLGVVALFVVLGVIGAVTGSDEDAAAGSAVAQPANDKPVVDPDATFTALFSTESDTLTKIGNEGGAAGEAYGNMDIQSGVTHATNAADLLGGLVDKYEGKPETQASDLGRDTMDVLSQCQGAYADSATAAAALDIDGLNQAAADLNTCAGGLNRLTKRMFS